MNAGVLARIGAPVVPSRKGSPEIVSPFFSAGLKNVKARACCPLPRTFRAKVLDRDLTIAPPPPDYTAHSVIDNFMNVYAGCGFDAACSYVPVSEVTADFHCVTKFTVPAEMRPSLLAAVRT